MTIPLARAFQVSVVFKCNFFTIQNHDKNYQDLHHRDPSKITINLVLVGKKYLLRKIKTVL
jgi:hypothetical protein